MARVQLRGFRGPQLRWDPGQEPFYAMGLVLVLEKKIQGAHTQPHRPEAPGEGHTGGAR